MPLDLIHRYTLIENGFGYRIEFSGSLIIDDRPVYQVLVYRIGKNGAAQLADRSFYRITPDGDIYKTGEQPPQFIWLIRWFDEPELVLKGRMEIGRTYQIKTVNTRKEAVFTQVRLIKCGDMKLKNATVPVLIVERTVEVAGRQTVSEEQYYAKDLGLIAVRGALRCPGCGILPWGGRNTSLLFGEDSR